MPELKSPPIEPAAFFQLPDWQDHPQYPIAATLPAVAGTIALTVVAVLEQDVAPVMGMQDISFIAVPAGQVAVVVVPVAPLYVYMSAENVEPFDNNVPAEPDPFFHTPDWQED